MGRGVLFSFKGETKRVVDERRSQFFVNVFRRKGWAAAYFFFFSNLFKVDTILQQHE